MPGGDPLTGPALPHPVILPDGAALIGPTIVLAPLNTLPDGTALTGPTIVLAYHLNALPDGASLIGPAMVLAYP